MANNFKDTNIYGSFAVKPLYQTYSNIGVASGNIIVPAYFQNTGNTVFNNLQYHVALIQREYWEFDEMQT